MFLLFLRKTFPAVSLWFIFH